MEASLTEKIPTSQAIAYIVVVLLVVGWVGYDKVTSPASSQPGFDYSAYQPEAVIKLTAPAMGCVSKQALDQALKYTVAHASTKLRGMFEDMECVSLDQKSDYKILQNVDNDLEVVPASSDATNGLWTIYGQTLTAIVKPAPGS